MVDIKSAARCAISAYSAAIALGGNYTVPLPELASEVSSFFLPNYTSYTLGKSAISANQSVVAENFISLYTEWRNSGGPGTVVEVTHTKMQPVSNETALCWLTFHIYPQDGMEEWEWTNVYGFHLVEGGMENGLDGGWEFGIGDNEHLEYAKRFGSG